MLTLRTADSELCLLPECGGSIAAWRWRALDIFRPWDRKSGPLGFASFPLVPSSNRIAGGRFVVDGDDVILPSNLQQGGRSQTIHGFGWQSVWTIDAQGPMHARLHHDHPGGAWPWPYRAEQVFDLSADGLVQTLSLTNHGATPMPAGLGAHPYFPRAGARLDLSVTGRWEVDADRLPTGWTPLMVAPDWLGGASIDHGFTGRSGPIRIVWPDRALTITPDAALAHTIVYVPPDADYFCIEPVSHMTNAVNRGESAAVTGLRWLAPGKTWECTIAYAVAAR